MSKPMADRDFIKFRSKRRLFVIINNELKIAQKNYSKSHDDWLIEENWIKSVKDPLYEDGTRGMMDPEGNLHFYVGEDLRLTKRAEKEFFKHLKELVEKLNISGDANVYGGMIWGEDEILWSRENGIQWLPRKDFGLVKNFI